MTCKHGKFYRGHFHCFAFMSNIQKYPQKAKILICSVNVSFLHEFNPSAKSSCIEIVYRTNPTKMFMFTIKCPLKSMTKAFILLLNS